MRTARSGLAAGRSRTRIHGCTHDRCLRNVGGTESSMSRPSPGSQETDIARKGPTPLGASDAFALRSDLARYSLSRDGRDETRHLAWTNSICVVVLMIAAMGLRQPPITVRPPRPPPES